MTKKEILGLIEKLLNDEVFDKQVGGDHYKMRTIQPIIFHKLCNHSYLVATVYDYLIRDKGRRLLNLEKAKHHIEMEIVYERLVSGIEIEHSLKDIDKWGKAIKCDVRYCKIPGTEINGWTLCEDHHTELAQHHNISLGDENE